MLIIPKRNLLITKTCNPTHAIHQFALAKTNFWVLRISGNLLKSHCRKLPKLSTIMSSSNSFCIFVIVAKHWSVLEIAILRSYIATIASKASSWSITTFHNLDGCINKESIISGCFLHYPPQNIASHEDGSYVSHHVVYKDLSCSQSSLAIWYTTFPPTSRGKRICGPYPPSKQDGLAKKTLRVKLDQLYCSM